MLNRLMLAAVCAVVLSAAVAPVAKAASMDIDVGTTTITVVDNAGAFTASNTGLFSIANGALAGDSIGGNFLLTTDFTGGVFHAGGTVSILGSLLDPSMTVIGTPGSVDLEGTINGFSQSGNALVFAFSTTVGKPASVGSAFGPSGIVQLTLANSINLGSTGTVAGIGGDVTAVPTPMASFGGLTLLGGLAVARYIRKLKFSC